METEEKCSLSPRRIKRRMALTEIFYNFCFASANFRTVFLQELGFGTGKIGLVSSLWLDEMTSLLNAFIVLWYKAACSQVSLRNKSMLLPVR